MPCGSGSLAEGVLVVDPTTEALSLARRGTSITAIADRLFDGDSEAAFAAISAALPARVEYGSVGQWRLDLERIEFALMQIAEAQASGSGGPAAHQTMLNLMDRRDRLAAKITRKGAGPIRLETDRAIAEAKHLGPMEAGAVKALQNLADAFDYLVDHDGLSPKGSLDNVTAPTYLRYCSELGLTPAGRARNAKLAAAAAAAERQNRGRGGRGQGGSGKASELRGAVAKLTG